jgi:recombination protein RecT
MTNGKKLPTQPPKKTSQSTSEMFNKNQGATTPSQDSPPPAAQSSGGYQGGGGYQAPARVAPKQWFAALKNKGELSKNAIQAVLPQGVTADRFLTTATLYVRNRPDLWGKDPAKMLQAFITAAQQGLDFGVPNEAHLVPYGDGVSMVRGYKGDLKMARRSPDITFIDANEVYENDTFEVDYGKSELVHTIPKKFAPRGEVVGFYAQAIDTKGNKFLIVMGNDEVLTHAKRFTKAAKKGPFAGVLTAGPAAENWIPYGLKTVVHLLCGRKLDLHTQMAPQFEEERRALNDEGPPDDIEFDLPSPEEVEREAAAGNVVDVTPEKKAEPKQDVAAEPEEDDEELEGGEPTDEEKAAILKQEMAEAEAEAANG